MCGVCVCVCTSMFACNNNSYTKDVPFVLSTRVHSTVTVTLLHVLCRSQLTRTTQDERSQVIFFKFTEPAESIHSLHYVALRSSQCFRRISTFTKHPTNSSTCSLHCYISRYLLSRAACKGRCCVALTDAP